MEIASTLLSSLSLAFGGALLSCLLALPVSILVVRYPGAWRAGPSACRTCCKRCRDW